MTRQQLPPQIRKVDTVDRTTGKSVVRYQVTVDGGKSSDGQRQQVRRRFASEKEARAAFAELQAGAIAGTFVPRRSITVAELAADWQAGLHNARPSTREHYRYMLQPLLERHGATAAQRLSRPDLDRLLTDLRDGGTVTAVGHVRRPWAPRSLNASVDAWRLLLSYGVERRELAHNAATGIRKVERVRAEVSTYDPGEIGKVLRAADADRNGHLWWLALSGLRRAEIAGLRWEDVDVAAGTVTIARGRVQVGPKTVAEGGPKTSAGRRTLPIDDTLMAVLRRTRAAQLREKMATGAGYVDSGFVAVNETGQPYLPGSLTNMWHRHTKAAGVRPIRLHDARHSCGTAMHLRNVPMAVIAQWLGHADASVTARIYAHSQDADLRAAGATLAGVVTST